MGIIHKTTFMTFFLLSAFTMEHEIAKTQTCYGHVMLYIKYLFHSLNSFIGFKVTFHNPVRHWDHCIILPLMDFCIDLL